MHHWAIESIESLTISMKQCINDSEKGDAMRFLQSMLFAFIFFCLPSQGLADEEHQHSSGNPEKVGTVHFPISCAAKVQQPFERAVALLHSFWFQEANKGFVAVTEMDPDCAMGYWGIAMSLWYPLWEHPSEARLKQGQAAVAQAKSIGAKTEREKDYIAAIETFYTDVDTRDHRTRALAYEKAIEQVYRRYPQDREAAVFYALALNATALPTDKTYANQQKAGAPSWSRCLPRSRTTRAWRTTSSTVTTAHRWRVGRFLPHGATRRSPPRRHTHCICPRIFLLSSGCGRSRFSQTAPPPPPRRSTPCGAISYTPCST